MLLSSLILGGIFLFLLIFGLNAFIKQLQINFKVYKIPGPPGNLLRGNIYNLTKSPDFVFQWMRELAQSYYPLYKYWILGFTAVNLLNPYDFELVMSNMKHNEKGRIYDILHLWLGTGLLTSTGQKWQKRRKILTPAFHFSILQEFIKVFHEETAKLVKNLHDKCHAPFVNVTDEISGFTLNSIGATAMGTNFELKSKEGRNYKQAVYDIGQMFFTKISKPWLFEKLIFRIHPDYPKEKRIVDVLHNFTESVIREREKNFKPIKVEDLDSLSYLQRKRLAMLDLLLNAKHTEGSIDFEGIREEVDTFMFEGHDTTAIAITFSLLVLGSHPKIQQRIYEEISEIVGDNKEADYKTLQDLSYLECFIKEVLRLYPSVPLISRYLGEDITTYDGYELKKGTHIILHIYDLHRNPKFFPNPEKFDPDRFLPENSRDRHNFAFIPFSTGSRNCIGQKFAMLEVKAVLCGILSEFIVEAVDTPESVEFVADIVLRSKKNVHLKFVPRNKKFAN